MWPLRGGDSVTREDGEAAGRNENEEQLGGNLDSPAWDG